MDLVSAFRNLHVENTAVAMTESNNTVHFNDILCIECSISVKRKTINVTFSLHKQLGINKSLLKMKHSTLSGERKVRHNNDTAA